ncbi:MAG: UDP-N-acetylmuramoyl-L-alanyl-D-glutamate--2,6-diaminopimelate ligase [Sphingomicrobium sp.]
MRLGSLVGGDSEIEVSSAAIDSRKVTRGSLFGAFPGSIHNGEDFIVSAVERGAVAVVARPETKVAGAFHLADAEPRRLFAKLAAKLMAPYPETIVAVTGTNGKTSTVEMVRQLWRMAGHRSASIGTLGVTTADEQVATGLTTPDIVTFLSNLAGLKRMGISHVAYEASSHGLDQFRSEGMPVAAAAFTNLSRDHLDYHADMDDYFAAKMRLFDEVVDARGSAVVWSGDPRSGEVIAHARRRGLQLITVGPGAKTIELVSQTPTALGRTLLIRHEGKEQKLSLPLIGAYQAANVLVAAGLVLATGGEWTETFRGMARLAPVRGRLERAVITAGGVPVYVDYAHTPDGIEAAIAALRPHVTGRLIIVFGAGGDRDSGKRAAMGAVASRFADVAIVTDDNPRSEDPAAIRAAVMAGCSALREIGGRREAIAAAIREARDGDIVLLAGKGHEQGQILADRTIPFDDVTVARECAA